MPRMNGFHVCRLLKRDPRIAHIPIIILTAVDLRDTEFWSLRTGADAFLVKSSEAEELLKTIHGLTVTSTQTSESHPRLPHQNIATPGPEEILSNVCALMDEELDLATIERIELKTILHNLRDGVLTFNLSRRVTATNQAFCDMVGQNETQLMGNSFETALGKIAGPSAFLAFEAALSGQEALEQLSVVKSADGSEKPVAITAVPLKDFLGATIGCVCLFHDITKRRQIEALYERTQELDKIKNDLTHMIVHDLRTPLTSLIAGLQTLEPLESDREILDISVMGGHTLLGMINDLLDVGKMEEGLLSLEVSSFDLNELADEAFRQVSWLANDKRLIMRKEITPEIGTIQGDSDKIRRVIVNLIGNAVKFTPHEGQIVLAARVDHSTQEIVVSVSDTGEGIPKEAFGRIFEKFEQVETRKAGKKMSTGLGLTFCKLAVEAHGGRIWVESESGIGSTFIFTLPQRFDQNSIAA